MTDSKNEFPTIIGADAVFKGHLEFEKGVCLLGKFEGEIVSSGELVVAEGATLNGDVKAGGVRIEGHVKGNLKADSKIQLMASAKLEGDVQAARLEVAEGAVLIGRCVVGVNGKTPTPIATKPASVSAGSVTPDKSKTMNREPIAIKK